MPIIDIYNIINLFINICRQHACAIARSLGMKVVLIHRYSGILSAYGMALADVVREEQEACSKPYQIGKLLFNIIIVLFPQLTLFLALR